MIIAFAQITIIIIFIFFIFLIIFFMQGSNYIFYAGFKLYIHAGSNYIFMQGSNQKNDQFNELERILIQQETLHQKKCERIINTITTSSAQDHECEILMKCKLGSAQELMESINHAKYLKNMQVIVGEREIEEQILQETQQENNRLLSEIAGLESSLGEMKINESKYENTKKYLANQIVQLDEKLIKGGLNKVQGRTSMKNGLNFSLMRKENNQLAFNSSYIKLIEHYCERLKSNNKTIQFLRNKLLKLTTTKEQMLAKNEDCVLINKLILEKREELKEAEEVIQKKKMSLSENIQSFEAAVEGELPNELGSMLKVKRPLKQKYKQVYQSLLELVKKMVETSELEKISDYIQQA